MLTIWQKSKLILVVVFLYNEMRVEYIPHNTKTLFLIFLHRGLCTAKTNPKRKILSFYMWIDRPKKGLSH